MAAPNRSRDYLETRVSTASPAQLHLMLIDGALRFGREAEKAMLREDERAAYQPLMKTMAIVGEMLVGVRSGKSDVNEKLQRLYEFVYARLTAAYVNTDHKVMAEALRVLEFERETWRLACEKVAEAPAEPAPAASKATPIPHLGGSPTTSGLSIEA